MLSHLTALDSLTTPFFADPSLDIFRENDTSTSAPLSLELFCTDHKALTVGYPTHAPKPFAPSEDPSQLVPPPICLCTMCKSIFCSTL